MVHHHAPHVHWTQMPQHFEDNKDQYRRDKASTFADCEEGEMVAWLFGVEWDVLANHFVDLNAAMVEVEGVTFHGPGGPASSSTVADAESGILYGEEENIPKDRVREPLVARFESYNRQHRATVPRSVEGLEATSSVCLCSSSSGGSTSKSAGVGADEDANEAQVRLSKNNLHFLLKSKDLEEWNELALSTIVSPEAREAAREKLRKQNMTHDQIKELLLRRLRYQKFERVLAEKAGNGMFGAARAFWKQWGESEIRDWDGP